MQFKAARKVNNWNDLEKVTALVMALHARALDMLCILPATDKEDCHMLIAALKLHYRGQHLDTTAKSRRD